MVKTRGLGHININVSGIRRSLALHQGVFAWRSVLGGDAEVFLNTPETNDVPMLHETGLIGDLGIAPLAFAGYRENE